MPLKSAYEDLLGRTFSKIQGVWARLKYVAELRSNDGRYSHWGFERAHGAHAAQSAFARVHKSLIETVLRTKVSSLQQDLNNSSDQAGVSPGSYVSSLMASREHLLPASSPAWSRLHLQSVLQTLSVLTIPAKARHQASSPYRQPARLLPPLADASEGGPVSKTADEAEESAN